MKVRKGLGDQAEEKGTASNLYRLLKKAHLLRCARSPRFNVSANTPPLVDFHATSSFDFFSAIYFLIARRLFCLLRLCRFFRASSFMLILLVRGDKPAGCLRDGSSVRRRVSHPRRI